ncbi:hypothetical protein K438DRAFT_1842246 [Mycena galopus ATCC 62051]|nr:hypothetical protein K438DRAFT_1842246 [Mycena galopus ATCC 62051]
MTLQDEEATGEPPGNPGHLLPELQVTVEVLQDILRGNKSRAASTIIEPILAGLQQESQLARSVNNTRDGDLPAASAPPLMYGMPLSGVELLEPLVGEFCWEGDEYASTDEDGDLPLPPKNCWYPQAPSFNLETNLAYCRGKVYYSDFHVFEKPLIRRRALCTINPPEIEPAFDSPKLLPGMTRQILGVPYIQRVDSNAHHTVTIAVAQTSASLRQFGNGIADKVGMLEKELYELAFGHPDSPEDPSIVALYQLELKRNDRSSKPPPGSNSRDGSYSLASTVEKGQGLGCFQPAVQADTPMAQHVIQRTLTVVHELQQLILPCCLLKFEWEMIKFLTDDNNIFVFGGLGPGATGLQGNFSGTGDLKYSIGPQQGRWHTDLSDAYTFWTMGILLLRLPPGADPGPFMLGRCGLYIRETGVLIIYLVFRGNDLHSGFAPSYPAGPNQGWIDKEAVLAAYNMCALPQRVFLVPYVTEVGASRSAELSVTPPTTFGNLGAPVLHKIHSRSFAKHGKPILGSDFDRFTRLSCEVVFGARNALAYCSLFLDISNADLFSKIKYIDENKEVCSVGPPPFDLDIEVDAKWAMKMRRHFAWHRELSVKYLIQITKEMYYTVQACIKLERDLNEEVFSIVERRPIQSLSAPQSTEPARHVISEIVGRELVGGMTIWKIRIQDSSALMSVSETEADWLYQAPNRTKLAEYVQQHIPLDSCALRKMYAYMISEDPPRLLPEPDVPLDTLESDALEMDLDVPTGPEPLFLPGDDIPDPPSDFDGGDLDLPNNGDDSLIDVDSHSEHEKENDPGDDGGSLNDQGGRMDVDDDNIVVDPNTEMEVQSGEEDSDSDSENEDKDEEDVQPGEPLAAGAEMAGIIDYEISGIVEYSDKSVNAEDMFKAWNKRHHIKVKHQQKRRRSTDSDAEQTEKPDNVEAVHLIEDSCTFEACTKLLSSSTLEQELETLQGMVTTTPASSIRVFNPTTLLTQIGEQNITNTWISSYLQYDSMSNNSSLAAPLLESLEQVSILQHASQWEIGRILLTVYEWLTDTAPALVDALILAHTRGPASPNRDFPSFALLTDHVMLYIRDMQRQQLEAKPPKKKSKKSYLVDVSPSVALENAADRTISVSTSTAPINGAPSSSTSTPAVWPPPKLEEVPEGLYELRETTDENKTVEMPPVKTLYATDESVLTSAHSCLLELLCRELVWIPMTDTDASMNSGKRGKRRSIKPLKGKAAAVAEEKHRHVHARLVSRGAVLQCLVDACRESILASGAVFPILTSPTGMFPANLSSDKRFAAAVMSTKKEVTLRPLRDKLAQIIDLDPDIPFYAEELARYIHRRTLELEQRHVISQDQIDNPHALPPEQRPRPVPKKGARGKHIPVVNLQPDEVVDPSVAPVLFAIPAIILREALSKMRQGSGVVQPLRRILDGQNPATGSDSRSNLDHVNPARAASVNLRLLKSHIPGVKATTDVGLSNLLAWMLTGQGFTTQKFLSQQTFFFADANECIDTFKEFQSSNKAVVDHYLKSHPKATLASMKKLADYVVLDDANVWGQAANDLTVNPTIRGTGGQVILHENKFGPLFALPVKRVWKDFTRELFNKDPDEHPDIPRRKWLEGLQMIQSLGINSMKGNGLTTLQLANNLAFLNICAHPTAAEMGAWIAENPTLGAFKGLVLLCFKIHASDPIGIQVAFEVYYNHLDSFLSKEDKELIRFGAIFAEHLLCKDQRWSERYNAAMTTSLLAFARAQLASWTAGANLANHTHFPLSPSASISRS